MPAPLGNETLSLFFLQQIFRAHANAEEFINLRMIHNAPPTIDAATGLQKPGRTSTTGDWLISLQEIGATWRAHQGLFQRLKALNEDPEKPRNVYYGLAPRLSKNARQTKANCSGFIAFYLDLDVTPEWSFADRLQQIETWTKAGLAPSFTINSGHGIQVIWILTTRIDAAIGEPILKRMVEMAGCKCGGNTWDVTRILRLPGFLNVKRWFDNDRPACLIMTPSQEEIRALIASGAMLPRHDYRDFESFPDSRKNVIAATARAAVERGGDRDATHEQILSSIAGHEDARQIREIADKIMAETAKPVIDEEAKKVTDTWTPIISKIPLELDEIRLPKGARRWFNLYCRKGFSGLTAENLLYLKEALNLQENISASELDAKIIYQLIRSRYTFESIEEFWRRTDIRLRREDKEQRSPDYLRRTYDSMLQHYITAREQQGTVDASGQPALPQGTIFIDAKGHTRISMRGGLSEIVLTGTMKLLECFLDMDEAVEGKQEYLHIEATGFRGEKHDMIIQRAALQEVRSFVLSLKSDLHCLARHSSDLCAFYYWLQAQHKLPAPVGRFHSSVRYVEEEEKFAFPFYGITKTKITNHTNKHLLKIIRTHIPIARGWLDAVPPREDAAAVLQRVWPSLLKMHCPRLVSACLGSLAITAMRPIWLKYKNVEINLPTLNVRGGSCSGKTDTLFQLYRLTGSKNPQEQRISATSTAFGLSKMIEICKIVPVVLDEFKEEDEGVGKNQNMMTVRQLVRRFFSGEVVARGRADLTMTIQSLKAALWVAGESALERLGHLAELTRIFPINSDGWNLRASREHFQLVSDSPIHIIGPHFYQFLLTLSPEETWNDFNALIKHYEPILERHFGSLCRRAAANAACLIFGARLWDKFLLELNLSVPRLANVFNLQSEIVSHLAYHANHSGNLISAALSGRNVFFSRDEAWSFLDRLGKLVLHRDRAVTEQEERLTPCYHLDERKNSLYVFPTLAYDAYKQYSIRLQYPLFEFGTIMARFSMAHERKEPWITAMDHPYVIPGHIPQPAMVFNLKFLRDTGYWPGAASKPASETTQNFLADV